MSGLRAAWTCLTPIGGALFSVERYMHLRLRQRYSLLVAVAIVAVLGTALVAHAASAGATIKIAPTAALANPPSSVIVSVDYSCVPSAFSFGQVTVDQSQPTGAASGGRVDVFGFGSFNPTCDDKTHHASVIVSTFQGSFVPGSAGASAFVAAGAVFAQASNEVSIR